MTIKIKSRIITLAPDAGWGHSGESIGVAQLSDLDIEQLSDGGWGVSLYLGGPDWFLAANATKCQDTLELVDRIHDIDTSIPVWLQIEQPFKKTSLTWGTPQSWYETNWTENIELIDEGDIVGYEWERGFDNAILWLREHTDKPFIQYWHYVDVIEGNSAYLGVQHGIQWRLDQIDGALLEVYWPGDGADGVLFMDVFLALAPNMQWGMETSYSPLFTGSPYPQFYYWWSTPDLQLQLQRLIEAYWTIRFAAEKPPDFVSTHTLHETTPEICTTAGRINFFNQIHIAQAAERVDLINIATEGV